MSEYRSNTQNLRTFRKDLHDDCMTRRAEAHFELTDVIPTAGYVPSTPHLSLAPAHRSGWCSLYAALAKGRVEAQALRDLLAEQSIGGGSSDDLRHTCATLLLSKGVHLKFV